MNAAAITCAALLAWWGSDGALAPELASQIKRLDGHRVSVAADKQSFAIDDVAGEGPPLVGVVVRLDGATLALKTASGATLPLAGPLARPRIAGPGYKVWVIGDATPAGALFARRLGVLAPPWQHRGGPAGASPPVQ